MITFTHKRMTFELRPNKKGDYDVICEAENYWPCTVGFNDYYGFLIGLYRHGVRQDIMEIATKAINAYWKVNPRKKL